jgi:hypothetical protein
MEQKRTKWRWLWLAALGCFILAGSTGSLYRFGLLHGLPWGLSLVNVRHAHSHLMYFGWVTPALMGLILAWLPEITGRPLSSRFRWTAGGTVAAALLAYPLFLAYGYQAAVLGEARVPLSVLAATLNVLAWYAFMLLYFRTTRGVPRYRPLRFWDAALVFQALASLGAWGVAVVSRLPIDNPFWSLAMTHLFLDLFSEGWFVLAVLGLVSVAIPGRPGRLLRWGEQLVIMGLPVVFLLALPVNLVPAGLRVVAGVGGVMVGIGLLACIWSLWPVVSRSWAGWRLPLAMLALKAVLGLGMAIPAVAIWGQQNSLRVFYLHVLLLGFVSLGLLVAAREAWGAAAVPLQGWLIAGVLLLLLSLIPLTGWWPDGWSGRWRLELAAWVSLIPVAAASAMFVGALWRSRRGAAGQAAGALAER